MDKRSHTPIVINNFSKEDIPILVKIHKVAFADYMNTELGDKYLGKLFSLIIETPGSITLKAQIDSEICGYVFGAPIGYDKKLNKELFNVALLGAISHPSILFHKNFFKAVYGKIKVILGLKTKRNIANFLHGDGISLIAIGVHSGFLGKKVGLSLIEGFEKMARNNKMNYMRLSVFADNNKALSLYDKAGWRMLEKFGNTYYFWKKL